MQKISEPKVGIVILTRNRNGEVNECLKSLQKNSYKNKEILVIDGTINSGYAKGNNAGIAKLLKQKCEYILLVNDDTVSNPNLISKLVNSFHTDPSIGIVGPTITYFNKPRTIWYSGGYINKTFCYTTHPNMNKDIKYARTDYTDFVTGCCMMVRKDVFEEVGLLDTRFEYYFEDAFFCKKAFEKRYKSFVLKDPLIRHRVSSTLGSVGTNLMTPVRAFYYARNPFIMIKDENNFVFKCSQLLGQLLIRLPYYMVSISFSGKFQVLGWYLTGLWEGLWYLLGGRLPKHHGKKIK